MKLSQLLSQIEPKIPAAKATAFLRGFGLFRVPLLFSVRPTVIALNEQQAVVKIPLKRWTKNHLGSMYFGALAIGADCVVGIFAVHLLRKLKADAHLSFKDFHADFLKRPEADVYFVCEEGEKVQAFVKEVAHSSERKNCAIHAYAYCPSIGEEPVARFTLTLSLKRKK